MKYIKIFSGILFGLGCAIIFIGLAATVLPMIANDQLRLVLSSFEMPSENPLVNAINAMMTFSLQNCYLMMLIGAGIALIGALLMLFNRPAPQAQQTEAPRSPYALVPEEGAADSIPVWRSTRAPAAMENNPFADTSLPDLLTPKAAPVRAPKAEPNPFSTFAPAAAKPQDAYTPNVGIPIARATSHVSPYAPPPRPAAKENALPKEAFQEPAPAMQAQSQPAEQASSKPLPPAPAPAIAAQNIASTQPLTQPARTIAAPAGTSHVVIRSTFHANAVPESTVPEQLSEPEAPAQPASSNDCTDSHAPAEASQPAPAPASSRIKSTIGKHF
ncbi:MAG: hypothetical protein RR946_06910 [Clostridia bacterium]